MGQASFSSLLSTIDPARIEEEVEQFLVRKGLVRRMTNGRQITAEGRSYLAENSIES